ncbi:tubby-related protein 2 isoform X1 [Suricata suricatta]|uniref:tubby-related protein 2 isoform X1 n=1 Tax=Suricata suricatta TaxID=37032 RepID=UPI001155B4B5|nr:tubby-related protein 2 isoform X1 [Suricata suricatta]
MSQEDDMWKKEVLGDELAAMRLKKLEQQRRLLEKKQRRKRQEPLMVLANSDASLRSQRPWRREERRAGDSGFGNPFQQNVPEAHLRSGVHGALGMVICGGDGSCERGPLALPTEAVSSDPDLEEMSVENIPASPPPNQEPPGPRRRCWSACQQSGASAQEESKSQDVGNEYEAPTLGPDPGMDGDWGSGDLDSEKNEEESESAVNSPGAAEEEVSGTPEGESGAGSSGVECSSSSPSRAPGPRLGEDMEAYVLRPALYGRTMRCLITRDRRGIDKGMFPFFYLYLELADGRKHFLLAGRKRKRSKTSNYLISLDPTDLSRDGDNFVGKVRSNVLGTKFTIFDNGVNPERNFLLETARVREELGVVCYENNVSGFRGPRKMTVIIPGLDAHNQRISVQPQNEHDSLLSRLQRGSSQGLVLLQNKLPSWRYESATHGLTFHRRVTRPSVKNFQIVYRDYRELRRLCLPGQGSHYLVLQFGRVAPDVFTMDFCFPLSPLQAFAICLSRFDGKVSC